MAALKGETSGHIVLGASTTIAQYVLPPLLANFCRAYPAIRLHVFLVKILSKWLKGWPLGASDWG